MEPGSAIEGQSDTDVRAAGGNGEGPDGTSILVIDDDERLRKLLTIMLERGHCRPAAAASGAQARELLAAQRFELAICDVRMPGESGLELIESLREIDPEMAVMMISGEDDPIVAEVAIERGAYGYLVKPFGRNELMIGVSNALHRRTLERRDANHRERLETAVAERTKELRDLIGELRFAQRETVDRLARAVEARDAYTGGHIDRVGRLATLLGGWTGLDEQRCERLRLAAPMHDVGKLGVPDGILLKPGRLTAEERAQMEQHTVIGYEVLKGSRSELLECAATIALTHHERYDGGGYPHGVAGEEIPIEGRLTMVADVFDALLSDRVYRPAFPPEEAVRMIREGRGSQFDPSLVDAFLEHLPEVLAVVEAEADGVGARASQSRDGG